MDSTPAYEEATSGSDHKQQKQSPLFAPTMTGKPTSVKVDEGSSVDGANNRPAANNPFGGYYFNVAQKGKLILPTALWILIVIAGACFIGLFATFNKTLIALEKVEQNQHDLLKFVLRDQETPVTEPPVIVKLDDEHDKHKCQHRHHHHHESDTNKPEPLVSPPVVDLVVEDSMNDVGPMIGGPLSWFKLPDWTSLDPQPRPRPVEPLGGSSGLFQQFLPPRILDQLMGSSSDMGPVSGGIIIESGQQPGEADHGLGSISSIMKLVDRIFNSEQPKGISSDEKAVKENPFISANIDKLEINLNDNDNDEQLNKRKNKAYSNTREEEIVSLEKSVNDFVSKLIDGSETIDQRPQEPVFMRPVQKLGLPMEHTSHRPPLEGPFSPLANLLMPFNSIHPPMRHPQGVPEMQQLPDAIPSIVLAIGDLNGDDNNIAKPDAPPLSLGPQLIDLGSIKLDSRPDIHPTVKSPYEFNIEPDMLHPKNKLPLNEDPVMNAIAEEMANSVLNNMIPVHPMHPMQIPHLKPLPGSPDGPVESIETMPVIVPPKPADIEAPFPSFPKPLPPMLVKPDGDSKQKPENNMGDLFKMFFGLPPDSPLVVAPSMNPSAPMPADEREEVGQGLRSKQAENKTDDDKSESKTESTSSTPKPVTDESKPTPMVEIISKSTTATPTTAQPSVEPSSSASSTEEASDVGPFLESLFSNVFALPQFNKEQEPIKVEAQQSGGSKPEETKSDTLPQPLSLDALVSGPKYTVESTDDGLPKLTI